MHFPSSRGFLCFLCNLLRKSPQNVENIARLEGRRKKSRILLRLWLSRFFRSRFMLPNSFRNLWDLHLFPHLCLQMTYVIITSENSRWMLFRKDFMCDTSKVNGIKFVILVFRTVRLKKLLKAKHFIFQMNYVLIYKSECKRTVWGEVSITCASGNYGSYVNMNAKDHLSELIWIRKRIDKRFGEFIHIHLRGNGIPTERTHMHFFYSRAELGIQYTFKYAAIREDPWQELDTHTRPLSRGFLISITKLHLREDILGWWAGVQYECIYVKNHW